MKKGLLKRLLLGIMGIALVCAMCVIPGIRRVYASDSGGVNYTFDYKTGELTLYADTSSVMADYSANEKRPWEYYIGRSVVVKQGVSHIGDYAFDGCDKLTSVVVEGDSFMTIGKNAFSGCTSLKSISFSEGTDSIGEYAFYNCSSLTSVDLSDAQVSELRDYTFAGCSSLKEIKFYSNMYRIGANCFNGCSALESVKFPDTLTYIGDNAFEHCTLLDRIVIPRRVRYIGECCFVNCKNLHYVLFSMVRSGLKIGSYAFYGDVSLCTWDDPKALEKIYTESGPVKIVKAVSINDLRFETTDFENCVYTGEPIEPHIYWLAENEDGSTGYHSGDMSIVYENNVNAGKATAKVTGTGNIWGTKDFTYDINKAPSSLNIIYNGNESAKSSYTYSLKTSSSSVTTKLKISSSNGGPVKVVSSDKNIVDVKYDKNSDTWSMVVRKAGNAKITITANDEAGSNYEKVTRTISVKARYVQNITVPKSTVYMDLKTGAKKSIGAKAGGGAKLTYSSSNNGVVRVSSDGKLTMKGAGKAVVTINAAENSKYESKSIKVTYYVRPVEKKAKIEALTTGTTVTVTNPTPGSTLIVKVYSSASKKKLYTTRTKAVKNSRKVVIKTPSYRGIYKCYTEVYLKKNGVESRKYIDK